MKQKWPCIGWFLPCLLVLLAGCGGGGGTGAGVVFTPQNQQVGQGKTKAGRLSLTLPGVAGARVARKVPASTTGFLVRLSQEESWLPTAPASLPQKEFVYAARPEAQVVEIFDLPVGVWRATVQAGVLASVSATGQPGLSAVLAARTVYFAVDENQLVDVPVKLGLWAEGGKVATSGLGFDQGELLSFDHPYDTPRVMTVLFEDTIGCQMTLALTGYLACPAQAPGYSVMAADAPVASGSVAARSATPPPGVGVFRSLLSPGQWADVVVFSAGSLVEVDWGDGDFSQGVAGQRLTHLYEEPGFYVVEAFDEQTAASQRTFAAITVRRDDPGGGQVFLRPGLPIRAGHPFLLQAGIKAPTDFRLDLTEAGARLVLGVSAGATDTVGLAQLSGASSCGGLPVKPTATLSDKGQRFCLRINQQDFVLESTSLLQPPVSATAAIPAELGLRLVSGATPSPGARQ